MKLKQGCSIYSDYGVNISAEEYADEGVPIIRTSDVDGSGRLDLSGTKYVEQHVVGTKKLRKGDVLFSRSGTIGRAMVFNADVDATYAAYLVRFRPHPKRLLSKFIGYWAQSVGYWQQIGADTIQSTIGNFNANKFANLSIPEHDLPTQRAITDFLDRETARIDLLIEKKQRLVALLGEKAKSANELFFIDAEAIETQPLHRLYRVVTGKTPLRSEEDNFSADEGLPWATPANLGFLAPITSTKECLTDKGGEGQPVVEVGTVLLNGIGSIGKLGIAGTRLSFNQQIHALIAKRKIITDRFLFFQLFTMKDQMVRLANSTTLPILNGERLGRLELQIYDIDEQNHHCSNMDLLLQRQTMVEDKVNTSIERLREYRSALITAAVTGQISVSEWNKSGEVDRQLDALGDKASA